MMNVFYNTPSDAPAKFASVAVYACNSGHRELTSLEKVQFLGLPTLYTFSWSRVDPLGVVVGGGCVASANYASSSS